MKESGLPRKHGWSTWEVKDIPHWLSRDARFVKTGFKLCI